MMIISILSEMNKRLFYFFDIVSIKDTIFDLSRTIDRKSINSENKERKVFDTDLSEFSLSFISHVVYQTFHCSLLIDFAA